VSDAYDPFFSWKALAWPDQCRAIAAGQMPWPVQLTVYPTNRCNRNCRGCIMAAERASGAMLGEAVFTRLLADANELGVRSLHVAGGGEPTLYEHLNHAASFHGTAVLSTNGFRLSRRVCSWFKRVRVSVNAGSPRAYAEFTGCRESEYTDLVCKLVVVCERPRPWDIGLGLVADRHTPADIRQFIALADHVGADWVHIRPMYYPRESPEAAEVVRNWPAVAAAANETGAASRCRVYCVSDKFSGFWSDRHYSRCRATPLVAVVCADARLAVCQDVFTKWGDLNRQTFAEAWKSPEHSAAMREIDLSACPRCIMNRHNEVIEHCFLNDECLLEVL